MLVLLSKTNIFHSTSMSCFIKHSCPLNMLVLLTKTVVFHPQSTFCLIKHNFSLKHCCLYIYIYIYIYGGVSFVSRSAAHIKWAPSVAIPFHIMYFVRFGCGFDFVLSFVVFCVVKLAWIC